MFSRILGIFAIFALVVRTIESAPVKKARQFLPALPGYVPVYIRAGDTPLEDINPNLAEAFNSYAQKHSRLVFGRNFDKVQHVHVDDSLDNISDIEDLNLEEQNAVTASTDKPTLTEFQHIQKIPRN